LCDNPDAVSDKKILLVDYDQRALDGLAALFEPVGFAVTTAMDGLSAWEKYQVERPDLVVLEAILPRLHGFDLTKRIVQDSGGGVPVIIITGLYRGPQYRHEALTAFGAAEYMEKPVDEARLLQVVQDLLREKVDVGLDLPTPDEIAVFLRKRLAERRKA
jgi:DNA-binding response OmpR family regulator